MAPNAAPGDVVIAYFRALNSEDYTRAWMLGGENFGESFQEYSQRVGAVDNYDFQVGPVSGGNVSVHVNAHGKDGAVESYDLTYTVTGGVITAKVQD